jgi:hypothetical protein
MTGWPASGPWGHTCGEFNGTNSNINLGDITQLNAVSTFTICFWMNQDILNVLDHIFVKNALTGTDDITIYTTGAGNNLRIRLRNGGNTYGEFNYTTIVSAGSWNHFAIVFDGSQANNASKLTCYVNGVPVVLVFAGTIPATTSDLAGHDAYIGFTANTFDGRLWDMQFHSVALSRDEVNSIIHGPKVWS